MLTIRPAGAQETETRQVEYEENSDQQVDRFNARDPEGGNVYWSLTGDDASHFSLSTSKGGSTGLNFKSPPDYEMPSGGGATGTANVYKVTVQAGDGGADPFLEYAVTVTVTDVNEPGKIVLTQVQPQVGTGVGAMAADGTVIDADAANIAKIDPDTASAVSWQWARSSSMDGTYTDIEKNATSHTYTPVEGDIGMFLMATATYLDNTSDNNADERQVSAKSEYAVRARPMSNNAPVFPADAITASIPENTAPGHPIDMPVVATDSDDDPLIYSLTGADEDKFNIDPKTGQILTKTKLNTEGTAGTDPDACAANPCVVTVNATDPSEQAATRTVNITIANVNEAPTITAGGMAHDYAENAHEASPTLTVSTTTYTTAATDTGDTATLSVAGTDGGKFEITGGTLAFMSAPDFETPGDADKDNVYEIEVVTSDTESNKSSRRVTIKVTNVEEDGTVTLSTRQGQVGVRVTAKLTDGDGGERNQKWQWYQGTHTVDATGTVTGTVATGPGNATATYTPVADDTTAGLSVHVTYTDAATAVTADPAAATDVPGEKETASFTTTALPVRAVPDSNTPPEFRFDDPDDTPDAGAIKIPDGKAFPGAQNVAENQAAGTVVGTVTLNTDETAVEGTPTAVPVTASDDTDDNSSTGQLLTYSLSGPDAAYFTIAADTGQISTKARFDYEKKNSYRVRVKATDGSGASDSIDVNIKVINLDESVKITGDKIVDYTENGMGAVATYSATDPEGQPVTLSLADATTDANAVDGGLFEINPRSGVLSFKKSPDYEKPQDRADTGDTDNACADTLGNGECSNAYRVTVTATVPTGAGNTTPITDSVVIRVANEPEGPKFPSSTDNVLTITENTVDVTDTTRVVGNPVLATDSDGANDPLTYTLGGPDAESFTINSATAQIMTAVFLDYEVKNTYSVVVTATDWSDRSADLTVTIEVADVDEAVEDINLSVTGSAAVNYDENGTDAVGEYMAEASGADPATVDWTLGGNDAGAFMLEGTGASRMLKFSSAPDFEAPADTGADNVYNVTLVITHPTEDTISGNLPVAVTVANVDEDASVTITPDTQPQAGSMLTAELMDGDDETGVSWQWSKSMTMDGQFMDIANATMNTYTPAEDDGSHYLRAMATYTDSTFGMKTEMATTTATVNRAPMLSAESYSAMVDENSAGGTTVAEDVMATDADGDTLAYSLRGNGNTNFAIGSDGVVTVAQGASLDHEAMTSFSLTVMVDDGSGGSDTAMLEITVTNVDEPPAITGDSNVDYAENSTDAVGTYTATDPEGADIAWSLSGADMGAFSISDAGVLSFSASPNHEAPTDADTNNVYMVTVMASDGTTMATSREVAVTVTDVDEGGSVTVTPGSAMVGTELSASLSDPDTGVANTAWQWSRSGADIDGATAASYTVTAADAGMSLMATATYDDTHGTGKTVSSDAVMVMADLVGGYDDNGDGSIDVVELFDAVDDYFNGDIDLDELFEVINAHFG